MLDDGDVDFVFIVGFEEEEVVVVVCGVVVFSPCKWGRKNIVKYRNPIKHLKNVH